MYCNSNSNFI